MDTGEVEKSESSRALDEFVEKIVPKEHGITANEFKQLLNSATEAKKLVVVDIRSEDEIRVSRIPDAITKAELEDRVKRGEVTKDNATIVCYCTLGYRSALETNDLRGKGFDAYNLRGAILAWTHVPGAVLLDSEDRPTPKVHTFSKKFSGTVGPGFEPVTTFTKAPVGNITKTLLQAGSQRVKKLFGFGNGRK